MDDVKRLTPIAVEETRELSTTTSTVQDTANYLQAASDNSQQQVQPKRRRVYVVTVPVKDIGPTRKACIKLLSLAIGSPLTWAMHWAIRVDDTYFELQRPPGFAKPYLKVSTWSEDKWKEIITAAPISATLMTDSEIMAASQAYFAEKTSWYDLFGNNCQLFVHFSLRKIAPEDTTSAATSSHFDNTITTVLLVFSQLLMFPVVTAYLRWLRYCGCDQSSLQAYASLYSLFTAMTLSMTFMLFSQTYNLLAAPIYDLENGLIGVFAGLLSALTAFHPIVYVPLLTFPRAKQRKDGSWVVFTLMQQNALTTKDPEIGLKGNVPISAVILGGCIGLGVWMYIAIPFLIVQVFRRVRTHISTHHPNGLFEFFWILLTVPFMEFESD